MEAFGERNCIGTYCGSPVSGMTQFDLAKAAMNPQLAIDLLQTCYPSCVCICAGFTWVDGCESKPAHANQMNCAGPATVAKAAKDLGIKVVWYSTDYVFDGLTDGGKSAGPYSEDEPPSPLNVYGSSKLAGEAAVLAADPSALVIRTNVVFGPEAAGKNFIYQLCRKLQARETMNVPVDQIGTPTYNRDLAAATKALVEANASGVFNVGGCESLGRLAFAEVACSALNDLRKGEVAAFLDTALLSGVTTSNAGQAAKRPLTSGLTLDKTYAAIPGWKPRTVKEALADWMKNPRGKPLGQ